ncbi:MAG TPA: F0F1 ATP synthase subunit A [Acidimicrobiales bacterium]
MSVLAKLNFPPIGELIDWKSFGPLGFNKTALIDLIAMAGTLWLFFAAARKKSLIPRGVQNLAEFVIDFITDQIIMQTIGPDGMVFLPFLTALFCFIFIGNIFEIIPIFQFPANARMANPLLLALVVWVLFIYMGIKRQGFFGYIKSSLVPPGVPRALLILVTPIEALSTFIVRPFSLAIRLFANMLAGHLLLVTFALLTDALIFHNTIHILAPVAILPAAMDVAMTGFEVLVAVLQAFIFTILTAVYLGLSMHPEH